MSDQLSNHSVLFLESSKNIGGQELQLLQQMQELNLLGWKTKLLCKPQARIHDFAISQGLDVQAVCFRNALHLPSIKSVIQEINLYNPIALICHSGHDAAVAAISARLVGLFQVRAKVIRMRTYQPDIPSSFPFNYLFDKTFTPSEYLREKVLKNKNIHPSKIGVLYPGINFSTLDGASSDLPEHLVDWLQQHPGPVIAHGAMLRGEKGHTVILKSLPQVIKEMPDVRYVIAGEGPEKDNLQNLVAMLNLQDNVYFAGMVQPIASLLKISSLAVLPSLMEPLGMFQIESQYLGVPTLASNVDGIPETLIHKESGLLVPPGDVGAWTNQLIWVLTHLDEMRSLSENAKSFVKQKFSMAANTKKLIEIISS